VYSLPFPDRAFHFTLAHVVFCHLGKPEAALDEMIRVTRPGGCVAVFDNALGGGPSSGWNNRREPSLRQRLSDIEISLRAQDGRRKLGHGDFAVGCYMPSWFEARGLREVDARANERVRWIAPPYRSPAQRTELRNLRERLKQDPWRKGWCREHDHMLAGGVKDRDIRSCRRGATDSRRRLRRAFERGTLAYAWSGQFWCVWGFKPGRKNA
jgi:SAM-dependent methyltransferase